MANLLMRFANFVDWGVQIDLIMNVCHLRSLTLSVVKVLGEYAIVCQVVDST